MGSAPTTLRRLPVCEPTARLVAARQINRRVALPDVAAESPGCSAAIVARCAFALCELYRVFSPPESN